MKTKYPILDKRDLLIARVEIKFFRGNANYVVLNVYDERNVNSPIAQYKANEDFFAHENSVMRTSYNTKGKRLQIPEDTKFIIFEIAENGIPLPPTQHFKVMFDLS